MSFTNHLITAPITPPTPLFTPAHNTSPIVFNTLAGFRKNFTNPCQVFLRNRRVGPTTGNRLKRDAQFAKIVLIRCTNG